MNPITALVTGTDVATTTAWGNADPLDITLDRIAANTTAGIVELAIGARPVTNPDATLDRHRGRFTYIGHHTLPVGCGTNLRPAPDHHHAIADACARFDLRAYSAHPPSVKHTDRAGFYTWAAAYHDTLADIGVGFAVETMYVPRAADEAAKTGGYHLATPAEVWAFCDWATARGWTRPLVVDASHLHIGYQAGDWTEADIAELLAADLATELHLSENDGRVDAHRPLTDTHRVAGWVRGLTAPLVVDEGRRRTTTGRTPQAAMPL